MRECLRNSTSKSLILVDEFGKGTHPADGVALLVAVLERISLIRARTVVTTHFWEVFENIDITGSTLQILSEELDAGNILFKSYDQI